jgi:hypothetical protein
MFGAIGRSRMVLESLCLSLLLQLDYIDLAYIYIPRWSLVAVIAM